MREYGSVSPRFWIGETGKALRGQPEAQVLALYLMTCPHANMIGVFHCPVLYMAHETGLGMEVASKALASLTKAGFCDYDEASETVFVVRMAAHQVGEQLKADDKRVLGVRKEYERIAVARMKTQFLAIYSKAFHLTGEPPKQPEGKGDASPSDAPPKQLTGTGHEQNKKGSAKSRQTSLPDGFGISERVRSWAAEKGYTDVPQQLEAFVSYAKRKGARYVDWDEALMTAVREDWAKCRGKDGSPPRLQIIGGV